MAFLVALFKSNIANYIERDYVQKVFVNLFTGVNFQIGGKKFKIVPIFNITGNGTNATSNTAPENPFLACEKEKQFDERYTYYILIIMSLFIVIGLGFSQKRRQYRLNGGCKRLGLVIPMEVCGHSNRLPHVLTFGSTVYLIKRVAFENFELFPHVSDNTIIKVLLYVATIILYGLLFLPLLMCFTVDSIYGYVAVLMYTWLLLTNNLRLFDRCHSTKHVAVRFFKEFPVWFCLAFVFCCLIRRIYLLCKRKHFGFHTQDISFKNTSLDHLKSSYYGRRVTALLMNKTQQKEREVITGRTKDCVMFLQKYIYKNEPDFRYSARMLCTFIVSIFILYLIIFEYSNPLIGFYLQSKLYISSNQSYMYSGLDSTQVYLANRDAGRVISYFILPLIFAGFIAFLFGIFGIVRILINYRDTTKRLHKGQRKYGDGNQNNLGMLRDSLKYPGYQVAHAYNGMILHTIILILICYCVALFIFTEQLGYTAFIIPLLNKWAIIVACVAAYMIQRSLVNRFFLQEYGSVLAFKNRRFLFLFSYFIFYYNVIIGVLAFFKRFLKGCAIGAMMLPRLDLSVFSDRFAKTDNAHMAYMGFVKVEVSQSHPVMLTFIRLLLLSRRERWARIASCAGTSLSVEKARTTKARVAIARWHLAFTLVNNPGLRLERHGYRQALVEAKKMGHRPPLSDKYVLVDDALFKTVVKKRFMGTRRKISNLFKTRDVSGTNYPETTTIVFNYEQENAEFNIDYKLSMDPLKYGEDIENNIPSQTEPFTGNLK